MRSTPATHTLSLPATTTLHELGSRRTLTLPADRHNVSAIRKDDGIFTVVIDNRVYRVEAGAVENVRAIDD